MSTQTEHQLLPSASDDTQPEYINSGHPLRYGELSLEKKREVVETLFQEDIIKGVSSANKQLGKDRQPVAPIAPISVPPLMKEFSNTDQTQEPFTNVVALANYRANLLYQGKPNPNKIGKTISRIKNAVSHKK